MGVKGDGPETALKNQHCCRPAAGLPPVRGEVHEPVSRTETGHKKKKQHPVPQGINNAPPLSHHSRGGEDEDEDEDVRSPLQPRHDSNLLLCGEPGALTALAWLGLLAGRRGSGFIVGEQMCRALLPRAGSVPLRPAPGAAIVPAGPYSAALVCCAPLAPSLFPEEISIKNPSETPMSLNCR